MSPSYSTTDVRTAQPACDAVVVGGGIFGCALALRLRQSLDRVALFEREPSLLQRASYRNQARVHHGYHYPRSILTAMRSRVNFTRFVQDYAECICDDFEKYYAVGKIFSKVTAGQFALFCKRIGAPVAPAPKQVKALFNPHLIDNVFQVTEYAFDAVKLRERLAADLEEREVDVRAGTEVLAVAPAPGSRVRVTYRTQDGVESVEAGHVFNCTYSRINHLLASSGLPTIPLKHELTELALVEVPEHLRQVGITVMCGPFFSLMPFPAAGLHSLSHVRYTPHCSWQDGQSRPRATPEPRTGGTTGSNYPHMIRDAVRYLPSLGGCRHVDSLWEVKTVLPSSEVDDSRPILLMNHPGLENFTSVMGGKVDNIYDLFDELKGFRPEERVVHGCL